MDQPAFDRMSAELQSALLDVLPHLRAFARSLTRNRDQADDLVNDAIVRAISASRQFTPGTNFKAWIFTILRNLFYNEGRKRHSKFTSLDDLTVNEPSINASQEASLEFCDFRRAFWQLNPDQREVLILVGASGLSYEEAAAVCGCRVGTIKSRVSRARADLKRTLDEGTLATIRADTAPVSSGGIAEALEPSGSRKAPLRRAR